MSPKLHLDRDRIADFCRRNRIRRLELFGSVLRDDFRPDSDVDILVEFEPGAKVGLFALVAMTEELEKMLSRKVDLVTRRAIEQSDNYIRRRHILSRLEPVYVA